MLTEFKCGCEIVTQLDGTTKTIKVIKSNLCQKHKEQMSRKEPVDITDVKNVWNTNTKHLKTQIVFNGKPNFPCSGNSINKTTVGVRIWEGK